MVVKRIWLLRKSHHAEREQAAELTFTFIRLDFWDFGSYDVYIYYVHVSYMSINKIVKATHGAYTQTYHINSENVIGYWAEVSFLVCQCAISIGLLIDRQVNVELSSNTSEKRWIRVSRHYRLVWFTNFNRVSPSSLDFSSHTQCAKCCVLRPIKWCPHMVMCMCAVFFVFLGETPILK